MAKTSQELAYNYFMEADISGYIGEWVAVSDNKILAHGKNLKEVVEMAKALSNDKKFILAKVPSQETMIF
jgi:hypothetical protein